MRRKTILVIMMMIFMILSIPIVASADSPLDNMLKERSTGGIDKNKFQDFFQGLAIFTQETAISITVFFVLFGCIIIVLAIGLNHPEYSKWGRNTILFGLGIYAFIKIVPIVMYSI